MPPPRDRPPFVADERTLLVGWLDVQRALVPWKCEGLAGSDEHRAVLPSSPLMTVAGIVSHLRWAEHLWFEVIFLGRPAQGPMFTDVEDDDFRVEGVPLDQLLAAYAQQCATSNEILAAHALDDVGRHPDFPPSAATLRWMTLHVLEETARHVGHLDAVRELLDGSTGYA